MVGVRLGTARTTLVKRVKVDEVISASSLFVGDHVSFTPITRALAVQREIPRFLGNEGKLSQFPIFTRPIPQPIVWEPLTMSVIHAQPFIKVGSIKLTSISTSSMLHLGTSQSIRAESRIKHIRQLIRGRTLVEQEATLSE